MCCKVSPETHERYFRMLARHGAIDEILATLVWKLTQILEKQSIPAHYEQDNEERLERVIEGLTYAPASGQGSRRRKSNGR